MILSFGTKILCIKGCIDKQEIELLKEEMELSEPSSQITTAIYVLQSAVLNFGDNFWAHKFVKTNMNCRDKSEYQSRDSQTWKARIIKQRIIK